MHKPIVNAISDKEFIEIVQSSETMTELSLKLGFKQKAGGDSIKRIKDRMKKLNIQMKEKTKTKKEIQDEQSLKMTKPEKIIFNKTDDGDIKISVNFTNSNEVGLVGEKHFEFMCARYGIKFFKEISASLPYDYIIILNGEFKKVQVKTSEHISEGKIIFQTTHGRYISDKKVLKNYLKDDVDLFYLYSIELDTGFIIESTDDNPSTMTINLDTYSGQSRVRYAGEYTFKKFLQKYLDI